MDIAVNTSSKVKFHTNDDARESMDDLIDWALDLGTLTVHELITIVQKMIIEFRSLAAFVTGTMSWEEFEI